MSCYHHYGQGDWIGLVASMGGVGAGTAVDGTIAHVGADLRWGCKNFNINEWYW